MLVKITRATSKERMTTSIIFMDATSINYTSEGSVSYQHVIGIITGYDSHFEESRDYIT